MKAAVTTGKQTLELKDRPDPRPGPEEVVLGRDITQWLI